MAFRKRKLLFTLKRFIGFLKLFSQNKRGLAGVIILIFFIIIALIAPYLTPYDPVRDSYVASDYARPLWMIYLPGGENLTENMDLIPNPGFSTEASLEEWNFSAASVGQKATVELGFDSNKGKPDSSLGCAVITFKREDPDQLAGVAIARLTMDLYYPFQNPPKRFLSEPAVWVEGAEDVIVNVKITLERMDEGGKSESYLLWSGKIDNTTIYWLMPSPAIDSYDSGLKLKFGGITADPASVIFTGPGKYRYGGQVLFKDSKKETLGRDVRVRVYIDDLGFRIYGNAFGLLGTDQWGRDIFTQLIHGARISLIVGLLSALLSVGIGLILGLVAGYSGRITDEVIMRFTDMMLVLPQLPLLIVLIAIIGPSLWNLIVVIALLGWMSFARVIRSQVLSLKERPFVEAARAIGAGKFHIMARHILPNVMSLVYVSLATSVPMAIISEAALSWLGLFDPTVMSWGRMLHDAQFYEGIEKWWWIIPPGICIAAISVSFILLGYALDEILNPKLRARR